MIPPTLSVPTLALVMSIMRKGGPPSNLGVRDGVLAPCPASSNCVSSQSADPKHAVTPLAYSRSRDEAMADLKEIILAMRRTRITEESKGYIHTEFTSVIWRFVDDVEFFFDDDAKVIHVRSASRFGRFDFGVNRRRIERIRTLWEEHGT